MIGGGGIAGGPYPERLPHDFFSKQGKSYDSFDPGFSPRRTLCSPSVIFVWPRSFLVEKQVQNAREVVE